MTQPPEDATWRNRFILINLLRIGGTIVALIGILLWQSDVFVPGGRAWIGFPMAIAGIVISFWGHKPLVRRWQKPRP